MELCRGVAGPVRCMAAIEGNLAVGAGPRVHIFALRSGMLERIAFHDAQTAVTALTGIKAFLAYGDAIKGIAFLHASQNARQLTELSKVACLSACPAVCRHCFVFHASCVCVEVWARLVPALERPDAWRPQVSKLVHLAADLRHVQCMHMLEVHEAPSCITLARQMQYSQ